jgi:C-terminal processing protease CtpA/Prc
MCRPRRRRPCINSSRVGKSPPSVTLAPKKARTRPSLTGVTIYQPDTEPSPIGRKLFAALESTYSVPPSQTVQVDYGWDMEVIGNACYIIRVREGSDAARQRVHPGDMVKEVNGLKASRENLWRLEYIFKLLQPQPGLHVELVTPTGVTRELDLAAQIHKRKRIMDLTGSDGGSDIARLIEEGEKQRKSIRPVAFELSDQIYIVKLPSFFAGRESVRQVLRSARGHEVLILDLRGNTGGDLETLKALVGYLESGEVTIRNS